MKLCVRWLLMFISFCFTEKVYCQHNRPAVLYVGDTIEDYELTRLFNFPKESVHLSDLSEGILILDFWATWCSPCIRAFPKINALKKRFGSKIEVLSITVENGSLVKSFLDKLQVNLKVSPIVLADDVLFKKIFPHYVLPHYVWLDRNLKVVAITNERDLSESNVSRVLNGEPVSFNLKSDPLRIINQPNSSLISGPFYSVLADSQQIMQRIPDSGLYRYTTFSRFLEGGISAGSFSKTQISLQNLSVLWMYKVALMHNRPGIINNQSVVIEVKDSVLYEKITGKEFGTGTSVLKSLSIKENLLWKQNNWYCYELQVPPWMEEEKFNIMLRDINDVFGKLYGVKGVIEVRDNEYLALREIDTFHRVYKSMGGEPKVRSTKFSVDIQNSGLANLVRELRVPLQNFPVLVDETGFKGKVDISIECDLSNLNELNAELKRYGLVLSVGRRSIPTAVIKQE